MVTQGQPLYLTDLDDRQDILLDMSEYGKCVSVRVFHSEVASLLEEHRKTLSRLGGRAELESNYRFAARNVLSFDDDENWRRQEVHCTVRRRAAASAWRDFCSDCVILVCLRKSLHGKPIVIATSVDFKHTLFPPGGGLQQIKIRDRLRRAMKRSDTIKAHDAMRNSTADTTVV